MVYEVKSYRYGDLQIEEEKLIRLVEKLKERYGSNHELYTKDFIHEYQGRYFNNYGKYPSEAWNADFGRILKQFSGATNLIIETEQDVPVKDEADKPTTNSKWRIL